MCIRDSVDIVTSATDKYREDQDIYLEFITQCIRPMPHPKGECVRWREVSDRFTIWLSGAHPNMNGGNQKKELQTYINKRFGKPSKNSTYKTFYIRTEYDEDEEPEFS